MCGKHWFIACVASSMAIQDVNHGAAGPQHEHHTHNVKQYQVYCMQYFTTFPMITSTTEFKVFHGRDDFITFSSTYLYNNNYVHKEVQDPAKVYPGSNVLGSFGFKLSPLEEFQVNVLFFS